VFVADETLRAYAAQKRFSTATLERCVRCSPADQAVLLALAQRLRLGENHVRDVLDALETIAARRQCTFADVVADDTITQALQDGRGRNEQLHALKQGLRRLRFPQLVEAQQRLKSLVHALRFPRGVVVTFPEYLEGEEIVISVRAASAALLRTRAAELTAQLEGAELDEMYRILGGEA
jgi:hypothetical protein